MVYYRGELVANIVQPNVILQNGVMHIIDAVLPNDAKNPKAALSAYSVYSQSATAASVKRTSGAGRLFAERAY